MTKGTRQITFRVPNKIWEEFSIKVIRDGKNKTRLLLEFIERYLKKR